MDIDDIPLIAGHPALDFVNTVEGRGTATLVNYLGDFDRLAQWSRRVGLLAPGTCEQVRRAARRDPRAAVTAWRAAMDLRNQLNAIFRALARGEVPGRTSMAAFNAFVADALGHRRLAPTVSGDVAWCWSSGGTSPGVVTWEIALSAAALLTAAERRQRLKICANGPCDWMFLDQSRSHRRRWCRMSVCGNVAKVRSFRQRQRH